MDRRVTHLSGLPHLPRVPHLHVNRPLSARDGYAFEDYLNKRKRL